MANGKDASAPPPEPDEPDFALPFDEDQPDPEPELPEVVAEAVPFTYMGEVSAPALSRPVGVHSVNNDGLADYWCSGCQMYCGGTNAEGDPITCGCH